MGTPPGQLITFGPAGFEAYARLRFIPDPIRPGQQEADVEVGDDHLLDIEQTRRALHLLARFTSSAQDCYFCVWEGYSDIPLPTHVRSGALLELPHRRYGLLHGCIGDIDGWEAALGSGGPIAPPALVWPADQRWCLASDVDPHWAGIGASPAAIDALNAQTTLDVIRADPSGEQPEYR
ncbi:hypothetical protein [Pilimelia terevasa]|uniref:hypothetical protein n=1 Tax=Pilimelia terevasa TaxID=53372 RepID=UPI001E4E864D|nr:hypothetical protein [Pilimelia terevasa]